MSQFYIKFKINFKLFELSMIYEENCNLQFSKPAMARDNADIMYAFEEPNQYDDNESDTEANYYQFQQNQQMAYPRNNRRSNSKPVEECLGFKSDTNFGLPDYFGDNPKPIEIKNSRSKSRKNSKGSRSKSKKSKK